MTEMAEVESDSKISRSRQQLSVDSEELLAMNDEREADER